MLHELILRWLPRGAAAAMVLAATTAASAVDVTLDLNGFPNVTGGQLTGPGLESPIPLPAGEPEVRFEGLQAGERYHLDFFHSGGPFGSDFSFTIDEEGTGVASIRPASEQAPQVIEDFEPGTTSLTLRTHTIVFNANSGLTGQYFVRGLTAPYELGADAGPQEWTVVPGRYSVDVLSNRGKGNEDWAFFVDSDGQVSALDAMEEEARSAEYAEFEENRVLPRSVPVQFVIESAERVNFHATNALGEAQREGDTVTVTMPMTVGSGGVNVYSFGASRIVASDATMPDGERMQGVEGENDFQFSPYLRYDEEEGFYFVTVNGPAQRTSGTAEGVMDDGATPLKVKVTATILDPAEQAEEEEGEEADAAGQAAGEADDAEEQTPDAPAQDDQPAGPAQD